MIPAKKQKCLKASTNPNSSDQVPENLKCPVCFEVLLPPIYQCELGHNICNVCVDNLHECPLCKEGYGDTRNYFAEEMVSGLLLPCKYEEFGCKIVLPGSELKGHQDKCPCQPYRCPELACKEVVGVYQMGAHLKRHGFKEMVGDSHLAQLDIQDGHFDKKTEYNPWRISVFEREFYAVTTRQKDGNWCLWTWILGQPEDAKKFSCEIVLMSQDRDVIYRGPVHSLRVSSEEIIKSGNCLVVGDELIKTFRKNSQVTCGVRFIEGKNWNSKKLIKAAKKAKAKQQGRKKTPKVPATAGENTTAKIYQTPLVQMVKPPQSSLSLANATFQNLLQARTKSANTAKPLAPAPKIQIKAVSKARKIISEKTKGIISAEGDSKLPKRVNSKKTLLKAEDSEFMKSLKESLCCPGCNEVITGPPVYQCCIGHNLCAQCKSKRNDCPLCRGPVGVTRNFFAEELLYKAYQQCCFHAKGCSVCLPIAQIRLHENTCEHAPFECPFDTCYQKLCAKELLEHLKSHQIDIVEKQLEMQIPFPKTSSSSGVMLSTIPSIIQYKGIGFFPIISRDENGSWAFWVSSVEHGKYQYEVIVKKQSKTLVYHAPVNSLRATHNQVRATGSCLLTTDRVIKAMKTPGGKFDISVRIIPLDSSPSETFQVPLFFERKFLRAAEVGKVRLFANAETSDAPADESEDDDDDATRIDGLFSHRRNRRRQQRDEDEDEPTYLFTLQETPSGFSFQQISTSSSNLRTLNSNSNQRSYDDSNDGSECNLKCAEKRNEGIEVEEEKLGEITPEKVFSSKSSLACPTTPRNSTSEFLPEMANQSQSSSRISAENNERITRSSPSSIMKILAAELERVTENSEQLAKTVGKKVKPSLSPSPTPNFNEDYDLTSSYDSRRSSVESVKAKLSQHSFNLLPNIYRKSKADQEKSSERLARVRPLTSTNDKIVSKSSLSKSQKSKSGEILGLKKKKDCSTSTDDSEVKAIEAATSKDDSQTPDAEIESNNAVLGDVQLGESKSTITRLLKPTRSCLKVSSKTSSTESLTTLKSKQRVKFADDVPNEQANVEEAETEEEPFEEIPIRVGRDYAASSIDVIDNSSVENLQAESLGNLVAADENNNVLWNAERDFTQVKRNQRRKKKKSLNKHKKRSIPLGKRKAQLSLVDDNGNNLTTEDLSDVNGNNNTMGTSGDSGVQNEEFQVPVSEALIDLQDIDFDAPPARKWSLYNLAGVQMSNQAPNSIAERNEQQGTSSSNAVYYMGGCGGPFELDTDEADELLYEQYDEAILFTQTGHYAQMARPAAAELVEYGSQESLVYPMIKSTPTLHTISGFLNSSQDEFVEKPKEKSQSCQVGESLMNLAKEEEGTLDSEVDDTSDQEEADDEGSFGANLAASISKSVLNLADGIINTCSTVGNFISGLVSDNEEDIIEEDEEKEKVEETDENKNEQDDFDVDDPTSGSAGATGGTLVW